MTPRNPLRTARPARRDRHPRPAPQDEVARHRRAGGPEDTALYTCPCGESFRASVSASVTCPRCGTPQAW